MRFCEKLILLRKRKGLTQEEFSRAVGVSRQSVYKWESGQSYPEAAKLLEIRRLYGVSIDHLLDESIGIPFPSEVKNSPIIEEKPVIITPTPIIPEIKEEPKQSPATVETETIFPAPQTTETKKPTVQSTSVRPVTATVTVQKKKKKPNTLREIVGAFFGKRH